jgi:hypothetical protein
MTAIPSQILPLPATDATVAAGLPEAGLSTRFDPSTAISQGVIGGRAFGGRVMNWILGGFGDWLAYLREADGLRLTDTPRLVYIPTATVAELNHPTPYPGYNIGGGETMYDTGNGAQPVIYQTTSNCFFCWHISDILPRDGILTEVSVQVKGIGWVGPPTGVPAMALQARYPDGTMSPVGATVTDPNTTDVLFNLVHDLSITGLSVDLDNAGGLSPVALMLCVQGATFEALPYAPTVCFAAPRCKVKSKMWA